MTDSIYKGMEPEQYEELLSNFLISSWSYSKISGFARNEKAFEMQYIFGLFSRKSASTVAGNAYHHALQYYFTQKKAGKHIPLPELEIAAFAYIDDVAPNKWKLQKTTPTVEEAQQKALKIVTALLRNFWTEKGLYEDDVAEVLAVEVRCEEFLTVNGVDIPLPCHAEIDLVLLMKSGEIIVIDHKSKAQFTDDDEIALSIGVQAMTYTLCYEAKTGRTVSQVWFIENKYSQNKDKSAQLYRFPVVMDQNTRRLYEALLYEPLRRVIEAVSNPDYVYLINQNDAFIDKAELYDFWCRTMLCEVEDFNVEETKKALVSKRLKKIRDASVDMIPPTVIKRFKENASKFIQYDISMSDLTPQQKIEHTLKTFGILTQVAYTFEGYSSNTHLLEVGAGVKVASIFKYRLDIANALDVANVRISQQMVVHQGKSYLAIDIAKKRDKDLYFTTSDLQGFRIPIGKDNYGNTIVWDLDNHSTPHVLVCGATGSGKSVCVYNTILYAIEAGIEEIIVLDPKYEFRHLAGIGVDIFCEIAEIEEAVEGIVAEMENRVKNGSKRKTLIVFDEFADAFANAKSGVELKKYGKVAELSARGNIKTKHIHTGTDNSLEENLRLILQKGRSSGFRVMAATQRASAKVITGDAKVNFPVQICFRVPKEADSRVVLDEAGAESLAGKGDGLIKSPEYNDTIRFQAYYKPSNVTA